MKALEKTAVYIEGRGYIEYCEFDWISNQKEYGVVPDVKYARIYVYSHAAKIKKDLEKQGIDCYIVLIEKNEQGEYVAKKRLKRNAS